MRKSRKSGMRRCRNAAPRRRLVMSQGSAEDSKGSEVSCSAPKKGSRCSAENFDR